MENRDEQHDAAGRQYQRGQPSPRTTTSYEGLSPWQYVQDIGQGNFGVTKLFIDTLSGHHVAVKLIPRGEAIDQNVMREVVIHHSLRHPNIVGFKEVRLTPTHLAIGMEYASGGELFDRILKAGRFIENEARFYFQQLISGVAYCHSRGVCHRDLKLENVLLDVSSGGAPIIKICDFGYSKSSLLHSQPKSTVGTPAYIAPEVLKRQKTYDGRQSDVWSCGVTLYVLLVGSYPFEDANDPRNFRKTIQKIMEADYSLPPHINLSAECVNLLTLMFELNPARRITISQIMCHDFYLKNLPIEIVELNKRINLSQNSNNNNEDSMNPCEDTLRPKQARNEVELIVDAARQLVL